METLTLSNLTGLTEGYAASTGSSLDTGDLRRRYNFGKTISSLNIKQDPFFRVMSQLRKETVDDSQFKFIEERPSWHKRYGYVVAHSSDGSSYTTNNATVTATDIEQGDTWYVKMKTDYKAAGNVGSRFGNSNNAVAIGATGTRPNFYFPGLLVKIPFGSTFNTPTDYIIGKVEEATNGTDEDVILKLTITRTLATNTNVELQWLTAIAPMANTYNVENASIKANLESKKSYISGNAFAKGSGYPETWADNPYSTGYGLTQIWKTSLGMDNTTRATVLKYAGNEWQRVWGNKLIEHKWDIETDLLFSSQYTDGEGIQYTQGLIDYIINYGQVFSLDHSTKTPDDFLDDMCQFFDPRINNASSTLFMCDTYTYNWLNKLSGYFNNTVQMSPNFRADFAYKGSSNLLGLDVNTISTIYGNMNIVRNVHLDGTGIYIAAANIGHSKWRPLVGNGLNRDTAIYVGVQTLENTGIDKRVDLILTEGGAQYDAPETFAIWKA